MMTSFYNLLKYAATGQASPDMTYYDRMRASTLMGGAIKTLTGVPPLSFRANGKPLVSWSVLGNRQQNGTPTPDTPIMPTFCGKLSGTDWTIPIISAGQTQNVYLGEVQTVRRIKKLVLTGEEDWSTQYVGPNRAVSIRKDELPLAPNMQVGTLNILSTHFKSIGDVSQLDIGKMASGRSYLNFDYDGINNVTNFKQWLASQYAAGTPVTIWYVLETPTTGIVNEPLAKIGDYADELHSEDAGVTIPTVRGSNTLTVDTNLQPSSMTITYR